MATTSLRRSLPSEGSWNGEVCVIAGGGPSLRSFEWPRLLGSPLRSIAINAAYQKLPNADFWFSEDARTVGQLFGGREDFKAFQGIKLLHLLDEGYEAEIAPYLDQLTIIRKKRNDKFWSKSWEEGLSSSSNSMVGALNVASILGASDIYLLGCDCRRTPEAANFHQAYPKDWQVSQGQLDDFANDFKYWAALNLRHRNVVNVINPEYPSALDCWPTMTYEDFYHHVL